MGRNANVASQIPAKILIHTPSMGRNRRIYDICTHLACRLMHYANQRQHLAYSQLHGVYIIINNSCERYGGFMCALRSHSIVHLFIGDPPFYTYSISYCHISPFSSDEYRKLILLFPLHEKTRHIGLLLWVPGVLSRINKGIEYKMEFCRRCCFPLCMYSIPHCNMSSFSADETCMRLLSGTRFPKKTETQFPACLSSTPVQERSPLPTQG